MTTIAYERVVCLDPTDSYLFKGAVFFDRLLARVKLRVFVEITRLFLLGFHDDFRRFLQGVERAEDRSQSDAQFKAVWACKLRAAEKMAKLVQLLESMEHVLYNGKDLLDCLLGRDRFEEFRLFVKATMVEREGEVVLDQAKRQFMASFAKRKLTRNQRTGLLEKYRELTQVVSGSVESPPRI